MTDAACGKVTTMSLHSMMSDMAVELSSMTDTGVTDHIGHYARQAVGADDSGILLAKAHKKIETPVSTSRKVNTAHALQVELDEGPCLSVIRDTDTVLYTGDTRTDARWPEWGPRCAALGYASAMSVRLELGQRRYGSLNVYASRTDAFTSADTEVMLVLAAHASVGLAAAQDRDNLTQALDNRTVIGQAEGILMLAYSIDADTAFAYLSRVSQTRNVKLAQVARDVVERRGQIAQDIAAEAGSGPAVDPGQN